MVKMDVYTILALLLIMMVPPTESYRCVKFAGAGIYFWWQAGVCKYLSEERAAAVGNGNPLSMQLPVVGASAGALAATLMVNNVSFDLAASFAIDQAYRYGLFEKRLGLFGIWGTLVREWLEALLPDKIDPLVASNLYLSVTPFPRFWRGTELATGFDSKADLIEACMASTHIPLFMDKRLTARFRGKRYIDGSFWTFVSKRPHPERMPPALLADLGVGGLELDMLQQQQQQRRDKWTIADVPPNDLFVVDWRDDEVFRERAQGSIVTLITPDGLYEMMNAGYDYMKRKREDGAVAQSLIFM
jgi:hypothetical protein